MKIEDDGVTKYRVPDIGEAFPEPHGSGETYIEDVISRGKGLLRLYDENHPPNTRDPANAFGVDAAALDLREMIDRLTDIQDGRKQIESDLEIGIQYGVAYERLRVWLDSTDIEKRRASLQGAKESATSRKDERESNHDIIRADFEEIRNDNPGWTIGECERELCRRYDSTISVRTIQRARRGK